MFHFQYSIFHIPYFNIPISSKAEPSMNRTLRGIIIDSNDDHENACDSIRVNRDLDSNEIDESDLQYEKLDEQTISISFGTITFDDLEKLRINS
jgi:hypothetical protein